MGGFISIIKIPVALGFIAAVVILGITLKVTRVS